MRQVPVARLAALADGAPHNGFAAIGREAPPREAPPRAVVPGGDLDLRLLVEDVQDPRNLGALLRVCEGVGVGEVMVRDRGSAPLTPAAVKASAGAAEWLRLERIPNSASRIGELQREGFWVYGAAADGTAPWDLDLTGKVLLCLGGEQKGLRARTRQLCDHLVGLPMLGRVSSLNLATAASALLYEALRQRLQGEPKCE